MHLRKLSGFTLLEMLLAVVLFAVGSVVMLDLLHRAQAGSTGGENVLIATHLAAHRMEELRNMAYASLANEARAAVSDPTGFTRFERAVTVTTPYTNLRQVVVTVYWQAPGGETSVSLQTYRSAV